ncbi:MAG: DUF4116 domain-containing protein [Fibromonadaceae bacterium]|jgi:flagellar hook assembly protein FlgD|nr:DUF4116 domain-containing protein [Fibromonadaceae bacterium]
MNGVNNYYDSFYDLARGTDTNIRKVSQGQNGYNVANEGDTSAFKTDDTMGKDQFLNLLVAQLRYQDPMNPPENTEFVAQLAQFSQLEFTQNSTQAISRLAGNMQAFMDMQSLQAQSITNASATPLLGKEVRVMETAFDHRGLTEREFNIYLSEGNRYGVVLIKDADGKIVAEIDVAAESSKGGEVKVKWDGTDSKTGDKVLGGKYTIEVLDYSGSKTAGYAYQDGIVSGVSFSAAGAGLTINDVLYGLGYLIHVEKDDSEDLVSKQVYMESVSKRGLSLEFVPEKFKTADLCMVAVLENGAALAFVPESVMTEEICLAAVKNNGNVLKHVPEKFKTLEVCLAAVKDTSYAIDFVPENLREEVQKLLAA